MQLLGFAPRARGRGIATVLCLLAILLGGCGSSSQTSQTQIRQVVRAYLQAQADGNGHAACRWLAPSGRTELVSLVLAAARGVIAGHPTCARAVRLLRLIVGAPVLSSLVNVHVRRIRIQGLSARARIIDPARRFPPQRVGFQKGIGGWRIATVRG